MLYKKTVFLSLLLLYQSDHIIGQYQEEIITFKSANPFSLNDIIDNLDNQEEQTGGLLTFLPFKTSINIEFILLVSQVQFY